MNAASMRARGRSPGDDDRFQLKLTRWHNPTKNPQRVVLFDGDNTKTVVEWGPGETKDIPSRFDRAIHMTDCGGEACHKGAGYAGGTWFCLRGHTGQIVGGQAPLLVRKDVEETLLAALDPDLEAKAQAEADRAAAAIVAQNANAAMVVAQARATGLATAIAPPPPPPAPPAPAPDAPVPSAAIADASAPAAPAPTAAPARSRGSRE